MCDEASVRPGGAALQHHVWDKIHADGSKEHVGEEWYAFMEVVDEDDGINQRFLIPWSDDKVYEYPFDYLFRTQDEAFSFAEDFLLSGSLSIEEFESWVLVKKTVTKVCDVQVGGELRARIIEEVGE